MKDYKFINSNNENNYGLFDLHEKILEIMEYFHDLCKKHNLTYFLMGGTALGAARHNGFIPWDDDLDVFMPYKDYVKFLELKDKIDVTKFYIQIEDTEELPYFFSKLRINNTLFLDEHSTNQSYHQGIYIDIMCLNNAPNSKILQFKQYLCAGVLKTNSISRYGYKTNSVLKKYIIKLSNILVNDYTKQYLLKSVRKYNSKESKYVAHVFGRAKFKNSFYLREYFDESIDVRFERMKYKAPIGLLDYLMDRFGPHFMENPSKEVRDQYGTHSVFWDVNSYEKTN